MGWNIREDEFDHIGPPPAITVQDQKDGFVGTALFYGFGDDGSGNSAPVLSGKRAWDYALKRLWRETWQCEYINFNDPDNIRLRPGAPARPKGFYYGKFHPGERFIDFTVSRMRKGFLNETGCGPEGLQLLAITHPRLQGMMNKRKICFMAFADYDVAPYGYDDFFDAVQMFCSNDILGLGIGNVDQNYPLFGVPRLRFEVVKKRKIQSKKNHT